MFLSMERIRTPGLTDFVGRDFIGRDGAGVSRSKRQQEVAMAMGSLLTETKCMETAVLHGCARTHVCMMFAPFVCAFHHTYFIHLSRRSGWKYHAFVIDWSLFFFPSVGTLTSKYCPACSNDTTIVDVMSSRFLAP